MQRNVEDSPTKSARLDLTTALASIAIEAGEIALSYFQVGKRTNAGVQWKGDGSPVTEADFAVNAFLEPRLRDLWPGAGWLSEESSDDERRLDADDVFVVDPIDGTRGFARGDKHWCIAIALVSAGRPVAAVVHAPALGQTYTAAKGEGAFLNGTTLACNQRDALDRSRLQITCSASVADELNAAGVAFDYQPKIASLALRIVMVASGVYGAGFTARDSHDWDLAAADLVLEEAGGFLSGPDGQPLIYNRRSVKHGALTAAPRVLHSSLRSALAGTSLAQG